MSSRHVTAPFAVTYAYWVTDGAVTLTVSQIRVWAHRGHVRRMGTDAAGLALYSLDDIMARPIFAKVRADVV